MAARSPRFRRNSILTLGLLVAAAVPAAAQSTHYNQKYANKLAPFVPSPQRVIDRMLELAAPKPGETVFDLGCGDGRVLITAAQRFKAKAVGIEIDDKLVQRATDRIAQMNLQSQVKVIEGDLLRADLSGADIVVIYLLTLSNEILRPRLEQFLKPGARVVSYSYAVPGWKPLKIDKTDEQHGHTIYLYEMPPVKQ
jgi:protein-L-isoaspartate O-methyltransferase